MKTEQLSPLVLDAIVQKLDERTIGTRYHPEKHKFILTSKLIARLLRHDGNLHAVINQSEMAFFNKLIQFLADSPIIKSVMHNCRYDCNIDSNSNSYQLIVIRLGSLNILRGRKPDLIKDIKDIKGEAKYG